MYYNIPPFHLFVLLFSSTGFLTQHWYAIVKRFQIVGADTGNNTENQWTFVPRGLNRSYPMLGTEELAAIKKESFRAIFSKAFLAKFTLCVIATTSLLISILNFSDAQLKFWTHSFENQDFMRIEHAFERLTDDDARREWAELSGPVGSAGFVMSYYTAFFGGLIFWFFIVRRVFQLSSRIAVNATFRDLDATLHVLYHSLTRDRKFRILLLVALISTLMWWYLERWAATVLNDDPYLILGLTPPATFKEIKKAYRSKAMRYHLD